MNKYEWQKVESDKRVIRLNELHNVHCCGVCCNFEQSISKCMMKHMIVDSSAQQCDEVLR